MSVDLEFMRGFFYSQFWNTPPYPRTPFTNQTIIVTGANSGLGLEAARHFVRLNAAKLILACRSISKGEKAKEAIVASLPHTNAAKVAEVWHLDLASYDSVKQFAKRAEGLERLDVVVENAGIYTYDWMMTEDNESTITTNVVSTMLLGLLLLPKLRQTAVDFNTLPRLTFVASFVHYMTEFPERHADNIFDLVADKDKANMADRYNVSKLLEILIIRALGALTSTSKKPPVVINCLNPGWVWSDVMREYTGLTWLIFKASCWIFARSTEVGSRTLVWGAYGGMETHGQYMNDGKVGKVSKFVDSEEGRRTQEKVWEQLKRKLEGIQPGILQNI
ncbi:MAG: hypothetical protein M1835_004957 [Candelina submexicana]|nr:MAG: hypothetical protein M1835_004957 [Candelina submexicana]